MHLASPTAVACPLRHISLTNNTEWSRLNSFGFRDPDGTFWLVENSPDNVHLNYFDEDMEIKIYRDPVQDKLVSGGYYRSADMENGGIYEVNS